jgi:hypothetical protein
MSASINFHVYSDSKLEGELIVTSQIQELAKSPEQHSAHVRLVKGQSSLNLFFDSIDDIEKVAFHLSTLAMEAREAWASNGENSK